MPNAWMWLHSSDEPYYRIRLLTVESSWTGTIYLIYSILTLYLVKKLFNNFKARLYMITIIMSLLAYVFLTGSKGFFIVFVMSLIFFAFNSINIFRISIKNIIFSFLLLCCTALVFMILKDDFYSSLMSDIEKYTSVSTRLGLFMVAIKVFVTNPLGVGTGVYIVLLAESIQGIIELLREIFLTLFNVSPNLDELQRLMGTTKGLAIKSSFFNWLVQGGIGALLYFFYSCKVANQITKNDKMLRFCLIFVLISVFSFINLEIKYEIWLFFAFIDWNYQNNRPRLNSKI
ncbi:O-antigen ligase family protein [Bacillus cereus]|nr:O-antigen ligase family protein [Bacillus cereus]